MGDVEPTSGAESIEIVLRQHVVRRRDEVVDVVVAVAESGEGREARHLDRMPAQRRSSCNDRFVPHEVPARTFDPTAVAVVLCDLDGVVWLAHEPIPGSVEAVSAIRATGRRVLFVTNNSSKVVADQERALADIGIDGTGDVVSSAMAAATLVRSGERVLVVGGPGIAEAVEERGAVAVANDIDLGSDELAAIDAVVVGLDRDFDYARLHRAASAIHRGARLIATNHDPTYPTPDGPEPGGGSLVAAVSTAGLATPEYAGKPRRPMADVIVDILSGDGPRFEPGSAVMVGDRPDSDGLFAQTLGCPFVLVRSGVTAPGQRVPDDVTVDLDVVSLRAVAAALA